VGAGQAGPGDTKGAGGGEKAGGGGKDESATMMRPDPESGGGSSMPGGRVGGVNPLGGGERGSPAVTPNSGMQRRGPNQVRPGGSDMPGVPPGM